MSNNAPRPDLDAGTTKAQQVQGPTMQSRMLVQQALRTVAEKPPKVAALRIISFICGPYKYESKVICAQVVRQLCEELQTQGDCLERVVSASDGCPAYAGFEKDRPDIVVVLEIVRKGTVYSKEKTCLQALRGIRKIWSPGWFEAFGWVGADLGFNMLQDLRFMAIIHSKRGFSSQQCASDGRYMVQEPGNGNRVRSEALVRARDSACGYQECEQASPTGAQ